MSLFEVRIEDAAGDRLKVLWFNQPFLEGQLERGTNAWCSTAPSSATLAAASLMMSSPEYEIVDEADEAGIGARRPHRAGLREASRRLSGKALRRLLAAVIAGLPDELPDPLPQDGAASART